MAHLGFGDPIKQYPGQVQVTRAVKVLAPGKHFNGWRERECVLGSTRSVWTLQAEKLPWPSPRGDPGENQSEGRMKKWEVRGVRGGAKGVLKG